MCVNKFEYNLTNEEAAQIKKDYLELNMTQMVVMNIFLL